MGWTENMVKSPLTPPNPPRTPLTGVKRHFLDRQPPRREVVANTLKIKTGDLIGESRGVIIKVWIHVRDVAINFVANRLVGVPKNAANLGLNLSGENAIPKRLKHIIAHTERQKMVGIDPSPIQLNIVKVSA